MNTIDARLRRMLAGLDVREGFETRVMQRIAARVAHAGASGADLKAQFERRRELVRRRLRRESWSNGITIVGIGAAAGALVSRYSAEIVQWATASDSVATLDPLLVIGVTLAVLAAAVWPFVRKAPPS